MGSPGRRCAQLGRLGHQKGVPAHGIEQYEFEVPVGERGDVYDRYRIRVEEIEQSLGIVEQVMDTIPKGDYRWTIGSHTATKARIDESMEALIHHFKLFTEGYKVPAGETYVAVESPRGELGCYLVSDGGARPYRMHTRALRSPTSKPSPSPWPTH